MRRASGPLILILFLLASSFPAVAVGEDGVLREAWYLSKIAGTESGSICHRVFSIEGEESAAYRTVTSSTVVLDRVGQEKTIESEGWILEDCRGRILRIHHRESDSSNETVCEVIPRGDEAVLTLVSVGEPDSSTIPWNPDLLGPVGIRKLRKEKGYAAGTSYSYDMFSTDYARVITVSVNIKGSAETELLDNRRATLIHAAHTIDLLPGVVVNEWWDEEGELIKRSTEMMGRTRESFRTTVERATERAESDFDARCLLEVASPSDTNLPNPRDLDSILFAFEAVGADLSLPALVDDIRQQTIERSGRSATILVRAPNPTGYQKRPLLNPPDAIAPCLEPNAAVQSDHPSLRAEAARIVGRETDSWKAAQLLERYVFEHIEEKNLGSGFASAAEVFERKSADCIGHAVLLASLCRSVGVPARVAMGCVYLGGIFGGHMWTEVWINGHWYALDGIMGVGRADPTHVRFASSSLDESCPGESFASVLRGLADLDIKILEFTRGSATVVTGGTFKDYTIQGDRYTNVLYGIGFTKPAGSRFVNYERDFSSMTFTLVSVKGATEIVLKAMPAAYTFSMDDFKQRIKSQGGLVRSVIDVEIAGLRGKVFVTDSKGQRRRILAVVEKDTCYVFEAVIKDAARDVRFFQNVIDSIDFGD